MSVTLALMLVSASVGAQSFDARIVVHADQPGPRIDPNIYGQFVEHLGRGVYEGIWVGPDSAIPNTRGIRKDVVAALRKIKVPLVRWPGGCFGEIYHWRDGVGPREQRPVSVNTAWGDEPETNAFGTHEFMDFLEQVGAQPFLSVNLASGSPAEAQAWLQYMTGPVTSGPGQERARNGHPEPFKVPFIGVGNETWGCGGNMTPEFYSDVYRQYVSVLKPFGALVPSDANSDDYSWTDTFLSRALYRHVPGKQVESPLAYISRNRQVDWVSIHFYTFAGNDWGKKSPATGFTQDDWARAMDRTLKTDEMVAKHSAILGRHDPERKIGISFSEWGAWWATGKDRPSNLYQVNTLRDAVIAGLTLNIFHDHAERVRMANIAQMVNVLQSMVLTKGAKILLTPTYHVFDLYQGHQGASRVPIELETPRYTQGEVAIPSLSVSASKTAQGLITVSVVNLDPVRSARLRLDIQGSVVRKASGRVITAPLMDAHPDFDAPDPLEPATVRGIVIHGTTVTVAAPAKSVMDLELRP